MNVQGIKLQTQKTKKYLIYSKQNTKRGTNIEMNIIGTLPPTGNLKPNLKKPVPVFSRMPAKRAMI
jgi:hypothetical protein